MKKILLTVSMLFIVASSLAIKDKEDAYNKPLKKTLERLAHYPKTKKGRKIKIQLKGKPTPKKIKIGSEDTKIKNYAISFKGKIKDIILAIDPEEKELVAIKIAQKEITPEITYIVYTSFQRAFRNHYAKMKKRDTIHSTNVYPSTQQFIDLITKEIVLHLPKFERLLKQELENIEERKKYQRELYTGK